MTALTPVEKERQRRARSRAGHIRYGMQTMADTFEHIARARAEGDHLTLGYKTWQEYVDGEFGALRVKLSVEQRNQFVQLLALAGASQREIAHTVGASVGTVNADLAGVQNRTPAEDDDAGQPVSAPLVDAFKTSIEDADRRATDHRDRQPGDTDATPPASVADDPGGLPSDEESAGPEFDEPPAVDSGPPTSGSGVTSPTPDPEQERTDEVCPTCGKPRWETS